MHPQIELDQVTKRFGKLQVLDGLTLSVRKGEITGLLGPNGCGKTTTIRVIAGVIQADRGRVSVDGLDPAAQGERVRQRIGVLTETAGLYPHLSALENLRFYGHLYGVADERRIRKLLDDFGLTPHLDRKAGTFSTGMKKRLGLAKALLHQPDILFLDEPTNGLDPEGIQQVLHEMVRLNREEGITILVCSHVLQQIEAVCQRYLFMELGRILEQGTPAELEQKYASTVVLRVETNLDLQGDQFHGVPARRPAPGLVEFTLPAREAVPGLLRLILQQADVYTVTQTERDLQSIYFKVREAMRHA